ncbi:hypothetical protein [Vibrio phage phiKT1024]|nr:hypothetical protein [Vibrio phage phiKT1024]
MSNQDSRVLQLRNLVKEKTEELGPKPEAKYKTNLKFDGKNILTMTLETLVLTLSEAMGKSEKFNLAAQMVDVDLDNPYQDIIDDIVLRAQILKYNTKQSELQSLVQTLDDLRSEDLKRSDSLDSIEKLLK